MSPHQAADSRTDRDEGVQRETHFLWLPLFDRYSRRQVTAASGSYAGHTQAYVDRTRSVCRTYAVHGIDSHDFFDGLFLAVFSEVLAVSSRIHRFLRFSDCPRVAACPQAGTAWMEAFPSGLSEGWVHNFSELCPHQLAPKFALNFQALQARPEQPLPPPRRGSPSC